VKRIPQHDIGMNCQEEAVATSITNLAGRDIEALKRMCKGVWPACEFYKGGTHLRVLIEGTSNGKSFYVETI
jgi:hypothetical protein